MTSADLDSGWAINPAAGYIPGLSMWGEPSAGLANKIVVDGEKTGMQAGSMSVTGLTLAGFRDEAPPTFATYRRMSRFPTIALAHLLVTGPIIAGAWQIEARDDAPEDAVDLIRCQFEAARSLIMRDALRSLIFGFYPFEKVWEHRVVNGVQRRVIKKFKPLLPELTEVLTLTNGTFAGLKNYPSRGQTVELSPDESWLFTNDGEGGNLLGSPRIENCRKAWSRWHEIDDRSGQLITKVAAIIPQVHYPKGMSKDANGDIVNNSVAAKRILDSLRTANGISIENGYANADDPRVQMELAGKSAWMISFLESAGASTNMGAMSDKQRYYDSLMLRGYFIPERAATEGQFGTKAEAEAHGNIRIVDCELLAGEVDRHINWYAVDDVLAMNYGEEARGSVWVKTAPIDDGRIAVFEKVLDAILNNPGSLEELLVQADMDSVLDALKIPKGDNTISFGATTVTPTPVLVPDPNAVPPGEPANRMDNLYTRANASLKGKAK